MAGGVQFARSYRAGAADAVAEIAARFDPAALAGLLFFCSHRFDRAALARALNERFEGVPLFGCTSSGEISDAGYDQDSLVALAFPRGAFELQVAHFPLDDFDPKQAQVQLRERAARAREAGQQLDARASHAALVLIDGLSAREEMFTMTTQDALGDIPLIGGSSADGLAFRDTAVFAEGAFHTDAAVLAILSSVRPLRVFRAQHYRAGPVRMVVTGARPADRVVTEINGEPAAAEYARLAGQPGAVLDTGFFASYPPMVRAGGDYYVRSIQSANPDGSLTFYCAIDEGIVLSIGEAIDRVQHIRALLGSYREELGGIDHVIGFDCVLNRLDAERRQVAREVSRLYAENHLVGFNTYGEQFHFSHVNQTLSGLVIGR